MKKSYFNAPLSWRIVGLAMLFSVLAGNSLLAQVSAYVFTSSTGVYTPLVGGTVLGTATNDDNNFGSFPLGFTFWYNGAPYTEAQIQNNGWISFGPTQVSSYTPLSTGTTNNVVSGGAHDLQNQVGGQLSYATIGSAPNRTFVVEYKNYRHYLAVGDSLNFQIRLYETTNCVEVAYGTHYQNATSRTAEVGLRGSSNADFNNRSVIAGTNTWATSVAGLVNTASCSLTTAVVPNSGQLYGWCAIAPAAPTTLTFTAVTTNGMTLNWIDNSTNENNFVIYRSLDGITYSQVGTVASLTSGTTGTPYNSGQAGLSSGTLYYWQVYAVGNVPSTPVSGQQATLPGTMCGTYTVGPTGAYTSLTAAFAAVTTNGMLCPVNFELQAAYVSTVETFPLVVGSGLGTSLLNTITVRPESGATNLSITSNSAATIQFAGGSYVSFDGRPAGLGTTAQLTVSNTVTTGSAVSYINDAHHNTLRYLNVRGVTSSTTNGVISFGNSSTTAGNSDNTVTLCDLSDGATTPNNMIYSNNTFTGAFNERNTISNNMISDFFSATLASNGLLLGTAGNRLWAVSGNSFYQTATRTATTANNHAYVNINSAAGNGYTVTGNFFGGGAPNAGGTAATYAGTVATRLNVLWITSGTGSVNTVTGNTITNFNLTTTSGATTVPGIFSGIYTQGAGSFTISGNTIGSTTGTNAIVTSCSTTGGLTVGWASTCSGTVVMTGNGIGGITANSSAPTISSSVTGILVSGGLNTISNNVVGSITAANSIMNAASAGTTAGNIQGIVCSSTLTNSFLSNSVANLTNRYGGTATGSITRGISVTSGLNTISNNTITALATLAPHASVDATASITGISATSTTAGAAQVVSGNTILGLGNGATTGNVNMNGIHFTGSTTFTHQIFRNTISAIGANTSGVAVINGINVVGGTSTVFNNMIALGLDAFGAPLVGSHEFNGIRKTSTTANSFYFNSVHISGSGVGTGIANTSGFRRTATGVDIVRNNIFANTRSNASSGGTHYAINLNLTTTITEDNNDFWGNGTGYVMGIVGVTAYPSLGLWKAGTNLDANSFHANPVFTTSTNLHINNPGVSVLESRGTVIGGITDDIDSQVRPGPVGSVNGGATAPDIGADEFDGFPVLIDVGVSALVTPGTGCPSDTVRYAIKNYASGTLNLAVNPVTVVSFTTGTNPQAFPNVVVNTGTIAAGATMDVVVSTTYSMAAAGTYTFRGYTQLGADVINGNDSLAATNFVVAGGTATSAKSTICELDSSLLTVAGFTNGGSVQWQSSPDNLAWTNIPGATSPTYMAVPTVLTYYRAVVCGLHNSVSDTVNVTIVPPPTVVGDTICGVGTANLSASGSATLQWYDQPSGGTVLTTGTTYSPTVSTTTNYYVANASGNNNGLHTTTYATNNGSSGNAFTVKALNSITITGFDGHTNTTTAGAWEIWYRPNDYLLSPGSQTSNVGWTLLVATPSVPALGTGLVTPIATGLSLTIPAGQTYSFQIFRPNGGVAYTNGTTLGAIYNANVDLEFYQGHGGTAFAGMTISPRVWNGRIHYASGCESPRVMVTATVTPPPAISTTQSAMTSCSGAPVDLIVASGNSGYSYGWAPGTGLNSTVNDTVIATPTVGTTYIVTATDTTLGCVASDTLIVGVANNPTVIATATPDTICAGDSIALTSLTTPIVAQLGNGTIVNTNQSYPAPFGNYFWGSRHQMLILASELQAAGLSAGPISAMSFDVTSLNLAVPHDNFEIKMGLTSVNAITTWQTPTFTSVFTSPSYLPAVGIVPIPFSTNFMWDGLSNIIVETCHNNASYVDNVSVNQSTTAFSSTVFYYQDAAGVCSNIAVTGSIAQRPNLYFWAQGSYGYDWSPNGTLVTPNAANTVGTASATTDFVIMVTDSSTGCVGSDTTNVFANPVPVVNLGNDGYFCGTSTTLDAGNPGANYIWSTLDSTQTLFVNTNGTYDVQVTDSIGCSATDTVSITFSPFPVVNLGADTSACQGSSITLDAGIPGSSYNWSTTATTQTIAVTTTGSYSVALTDTFGCTGNDTVSVTFNALPSVSFVSTVDTVCSFAAAITLTGGSPSGGSYTGPGVTAGVFDPAAAGAGTHTITYDFTDGNGCSASATHVIVVEVCPGVADGFNSFNVGLYPNPNDGRFTFTVAMSADAEVSYEVADARGLVVLRDNSNQPSGVYSQEVNLNDFATGVYTLRVTVDGVTAHKRLVVQR